MRVGLILLAIGLVVPSGRGSTLDPPELFVPGDADYPTIDSRARQGISSLAVSPGGRLWATWYAGPTRDEDRNNYVVLATSGDDGATWEEVMVADPDGPGPLRAFDSQVWIDPDNHLWWFWAQAISHGRDAQTWAMITTNPESSHPEWTDPRHVAPGVMMSKPILHSSGDWMFPISDWEARLSGDPSAASAGVWVSTNRGDSVFLRGTALVPLEDRTFDEHMLIERLDGDLWMWVRTRSGIGVSVSQDHGKTWPVVAPGAVQHPAARFFIWRLQSGNLLLVKHGPIDVQTGRTDLTAYVSRDDGDTWEGGLLLDGRSSISYPDGQQSDDGRIYITYDYSRTGFKAILMAVFTEADALTGEDISGQVRLRELISEAPEEPDPNDDGVPLQTLPAGQWALPGGETLPFREGELIFPNRDYRLLEVPDELEGGWFVKGSIDAIEPAVCVTPGWVFFLTPRMNRNSDGQETHLESLGFERVALQEMPLWRWMPSEFCSLYQKYCEVGERISFGKWAVPLFLSADRPYAPIQRIQASMSGYPVIEVHTQQDIDYVLQFTTNLVAYPPSWLPLASERAGQSGLLQLKDEEVSDPFRAYRVVIP